MNKTDNIKNIGLYITAHEGLINENIYNYFLYINNDINGFQVDNFITSFNEFINVDKKIDDLIIDKDRIYVICGKIINEFLINNTQTVEYNNDLFTNINETINKFAQSLNTLIEFKFKNIDMKLSIAELLGYYPTKRLHSFINDILFPSFGLQSETTFNFNDVFKQANIYQNFDTIILVLDKNRHMINIDMKY